MRPRIAICTSVHPSVDARVVFREGRALATAFDTTLWVFEDGIDEDLPATEPGRSLRIHRLGGKKGRLRRFLAGRSLLAAALADRPDVVLVHDPELLLWIGTVARRVPVVYDAHEDYAVMMLVKTWLPSFVRRAVSALVDKVERSAVRKCALLVVADDHLRERLGGTGTPSLVVRNYPPGDLLPPGSPLADRPPVVAYVGGVTAQRGLLIMLEAFEIVRSRVGDAELLIVGPAQDSAGLSLRERPGVRVSGRVSYAEIGGLLASARVGLALLADTPKYRRDVPSKLYDYMSCGVPYVASDLPGIRASVGESGGSLVAAGDAVAAADAIVRLLTDDAAALDAREGGLAAVRERFSFEGEGAALVTAIASVVEQRSDALRGADARP